MIPYINRTCDVILSDRIEAARVNVKEVIDEFRGQVEDYKSVFEAIVLMAPGRYRVTFKSHRKMEVAEHTGLLVRGLPVDFRPVSRYTWVNVTRLSYGVPDAEIVKVLEPYGSIRKMSSEVYSNIYTGVRHVLMDISQAIPFRLRIAGHWCFVHYKGQKRVCFACGQEGHTRRNCPDLAPPADPPSASSAPVPPVVEEQVVETLTSLVDNVVSSPSILGSEDVAPHLDSPLSGPSLPPESTATPMVIPESEPSGSLADSAVSVIPPTPIPIPLTRRNKRRHERKAGTPSPSPPRKDSRRDESPEPSLASSAVRTTSPVVVATPENLPLPPDDDNWVNAVSPLGNDMANDMASELSDSLLSVASPPILTVPEVLDASEETLFIRRFFLEGGTPSDENSDTS